MRADRRGLLTGRPASGPAPEPPVCVCMAVGAGAIRAAIAAGLHQRGCYWCSNDGWYELRIVPAGDRGGY